MIMVRGDGRIEHPRPEAPPATASISTSGNNTVSAAVGGGQRRAIYKWQAQTTADGDQVVLLQIGGTTVDGVVCASKSHGKVCDNCYYVIEPDEAVTINLSETTATRYFVWITNI